jgi:predicted N-acetyltransferase YhbS
MLDHADILVLALDDGKIVGVARAVTDFNYACYLSDLAVDVDYQKMGIGQKLIETVQNELEKSCKIILLSAPDAVGYYPKDIKGTGCAKGKFPLATRPLKNHFLSFKYYI